MHIVMIFFILNLAQLYYVLSCAVQCVKRHEKKKNQGIVDEHSKQDVFQRKRTERFNDYFLASWSR